jgi:hypothetical protein
MEKLQILIMNTPHSWHGFDAERALNETVEMANRRKEILANMTEPLPSIPPKETFKPVDNAEFFGFFEDLLKK